MGSIAFLGAISGITPDLSAKSIDQMFAISALAENISDAKITAFAKSLLKIEPLREQSLPKVVKLLGSSPTQRLICYKEDTMTELNSAAKNEFNKFCDRCVVILRNNGLTMDEFNRLTELYLNGTIRSRVDAKLEQLQ